MAGHRAAYKLTLDKVRDNSDVARADGVMLYEVVDSCDGWATRQRFQLRLTDRDGQEGRPPPTTRPSRPRTARRSASA